MSKRLLILTDNEPVTCRALAMDLTDAGYRVETAGNRDEAIRKLTNTPVDLLIAGEDPGKPWLLEVSRARSNVKVVLMTTEGGVTDSRNGSVVSVKKPFDLEDFRSVVERMLDPERTTWGSAK